MTPLPAPSEYICCMNGLVTMTSVVISTTELLAEEATAETSLLSKLLLTRDCVMTVVPSGAVAVSVAPKLLPRAVPINPPKMERTSEALKTPATNGVLDFFFGGAGGFGAKF